MQLSLEIKAKQQLSISPQLQQAIRLLQLSTLELKTEIQEAVERNPLLELEENDHTEIIEQLQSLSTISTTPAKRVLHLEGDSDDPYLNVEHPITLTEHLYNQLYLTNLSQTEHLIGAVIIDALNQDGYLPFSLSEIQLSLIEQDCPVQIEAIQSVLTEIQHFDPPGIGARSVQDCILLQLERLDQSKATTQNAMVLIRDQFELFSSKAFKKICRLNQWDHTTLSAAMQVIQSTNPRPGASYAQLVHHYVIPDVFVKKNDGVWQVFLNPFNNPSPKISPNSAALLSMAKSKQDTQYIRDHLKDAKWFINSISNRNNTLLNVSKAIMDYQIDFLEQGEMAMKPLRLLSIAETVNLHESTISRVTSNKYIHTPHGVFELKHFFSSQLQTDDGAACSSTSIKAQIKKLIDTENKAKPLSDNTITKLLKNDGISIARRTVTKYREALGILSSTERKDTATYP